jgi:protein-disulfide isomerase
MSLYRKKKRTGLKVFISFLFIISILIITAYYFFIPSSQINNLLNSDNPQEIDIQQVEAKNKIIDEPTPEVETDMNEYLKIEDLDQRIAKYIKENPDFLIKTLQEYQNKQNQIEQEKLSNQNLSNIKKLNSQTHSMFIGNDNSDIQIFEFVDYNCGYCLKFHNEVSSVISQESSLKLVIIQMPILGKMSDELSKLALASSLQGKFNEVHNYLYSSKRKSSMEDILADLFIMNIDITQLKKDIESEAVQKLSSQHENIVNDFKFVGTPAIIIGNTIIPGFIKADEISEILKKEFF